VGPVDGAGRALSGAGGPPPGGGLADERGRRAGARGRRVHFGKALAVEDDARYRELTLRSVEAVAAGLRLADPTLERIEVPFDAHYVVGNLRQPRGTARRRSSTRASCTAQGGWLRSCDDTI
jgi:hypothetical protein